MKNVNMIHFEYVYPMPKNLDKFLKKFRKIYEHAEMEKLKANY